MFLAHRKPYFDVCLVFHQFNYHDFYLGEIKNDG
uniref:Uncharacterized protein n=1 Tax=Arundo donax TaxID=35708 RepID=A0A0A9EGV0_ARUDO